MWCKIKFKQSSMDKIHLSDIGRNGEDTLKDVKDTVFTLISKNRDIYSDIKKLAGYKTTKISFEAKIISILCRWPSFSSAKYKSECKKWVSLPVIFQLLV